MHFYNKRKLYLDPTLTIYNSQIPVVSQIKFLGVIFDSKLNFKAHIDYIRQKCEKAMNLLKVVAKIDWGADLDPDPETIRIKIFWASCRGRFICCLSSAGSYSDCVIAKWPTLDYTETSHRLIPRPSKESSW